MKGDFMNIEKDTSKEQLRANIQSIANDLENGIVITAENIDEYDSGQYEIGDTISAYDYLRDVLDIEYRCDNKKQYRSASILVAFGGPNIWIDTKTQTVKGAWWGDYAETSYSSDAMGIDDACADLFNC